MAMAVRNSRLAPKIGNARLPTVVRQNLGSITGGSRPESQCMSHGRIKTDRAALVGKVVVLNLVTSYVLLSA